jgi:hypothetical protein
MRDIYILRICLKKQESRNVVSTILGVEPNTDSQDWEISFADEDNEGIFCEPEIEDQDLVDPEPEEPDEHYEFRYYYDDLLDILEGKYEDLEKVGIERDDISLWNIYEYNSQCNRELSPNEMKRMGENGISLHIVCKDICVY